MFLFSVIYNNSEKISSIKLLYLYPCSPQYQMEINFANREREEIKMAEMKAFNSLAEGLSRAIDRKRNAEMAKDGKAVLHYMKIYMEADELYIRTARFFCKVFANATIPNYTLFLSTKKVADLFPCSKNIEEMREALNLGIRFLKKGGWKHEWNKNLME